jgi:hypothetical protein
MMKRHQLAFCVSVIASYLFFYFGPQQGQLSPAGSIIASLLFTALAMPFVLLGFSIPYVLAELAQQVRDWPRWSPLLLVGPICLAIVALSYGLVQLPDEAVTLSGLGVMILHHSLVYWACSLVYGFPLVVIGYIQTRPEQDFAGGASSLSAPES